MNVKRSIHSDKAPKALGPYSQAIEMGNMLFCAGQIPIDPDSGSLVEGGIAEQTIRVFQNIKAVLNAADYDFNHVVKSTVFMTDLSHFAEMNEIYAKHFVEPFPARSTIQVSALPKGSMIEIEVIAVK